MIRCLIVDDEPIALRVLTSHLDKVPGVQLVGSCTNGVEALRVVNDEPIDLVFLDIEMPELAGIDFVESLSHPPAIVFTTAHRDYAVRGFELDAVDYLLKPISFSRLNRAVEKYRRLQITQRDRIETDAEVQSINIQVDRRTVRIELPSIRYVESLSDYVIVHTESDRFTTKLRLGDLDEQLAPHGFLRIHRSYVVSQRHIDSFTATEVQLGEAVLPVSRSYRREVIERLRDLSA